MNRTTKTILAALLLSTSTMAAEPTGAAALATKYLCDEGKVFSVNFILGARTATFDGKQWQNVEIVDTTLRHDDDDTQHPATQYTFENNGTRLYFMTGKGQARKGALLLPNSDDFLYCETPL